jgi:hypothetical protein
VEETANDKVAVAEEYEDNDGLDDKEDDGQDVDNISLSVLIYNDDHHLYLQSCSPFQNLNERGFWVNIMTS